MSNVRVRFAPSPTGALHVGGLRTALYNFLLARQTGGQFLLRIEDTDQTRYVPGAEEYILESLRWCGLTPDEGPGFGGPHAPYRQSERRALYQEAAQMLLDREQAYYAFDTPEELDLAREADPNFMYNAHARPRMRNSESLGEAQTQALLDAGTPYTIRLKVPSNETIHIKDLVRGDVFFQTDELDDKVLLKADGLPTYHLANVVDDHHMLITHVIRGEEWLPSTAHHVLLYRAFGWEDTMPSFSHLPLILKPSGQGKLSKRDGAKFGIPVFPLSWDGETPEDSFEGFREAGYDPKALLNFLAFLGWNPGTEQEIFSLDELVQAFSIEKIGKSGARFDVDKARWFNQQYIMHTPNEELADVLLPMLAAKGLSVSPEFVASFAGLMKERVTTYPDFLEEGYYFFYPVRSYDEATIKKKWKPERAALFASLNEHIHAQTDYSAAILEAEVKQFLTDNNLGFGDVLPILRIALAGTMKGPAVYDMMALLGKDEVKQRLATAFQSFGKMV